MTLAISLTPEVERQLASKASRAGMDLPTFAAHLLEAEAGRIESPDPKRSNPNQSTLDLFAKWAQEEAEMDPAEIQRGEQELRELMDGMNQARLDSDGPNARIPFPWRS